MERLIRLSINKLLLRKHLLLLREVDVVEEALVDGQLETFPHSLNDVLTVLRRVDYPADSLLQTLRLLVLLETLVRVKPEHPLHNSQYIEQQMSPGVCTCPPDAVFYAMEKDYWRVEHFYLRKLVFLKTLRDAVDQRILLTLYVRFQVGLEWIRYRSLESRQCLQVILLFVLSFHCLCVLFIHELGDFGLEL